MNETKVLDLIGDAKWHSVKVDVTKFVDAKKFQFSIKLYGETLGYDGSEMSFKGLLEMDVDDAFAEDKISDMLKSQVLEICKSIELALETGKIKCERAISIADCSCIATGKLTNAKAVFATKEDEVIKEIERKPFDIEIIFLEE